MKSIRKTQWLGLWDWIVLCTNVFRQLPLLHELKGVTVFVSRYENVAAVFNYADRARSPTVAPELREEHKSPHTLGEAMIL